jgi:hypothetical protein
VIVVYYADNNVGPYHWKFYLGKHGWYKFQIDLNIAAVNHAIEQEWEDLDGPYPNWMRQADFLPCEHKK